MTITDPLDEGRDSAKDARGEAREEAEAALARVKQLVAKSRGYSLRPQQVTRAIKGEPE